jgi:hypothetical protein
LIIIFVTFDQFCDFLFYHKQFIQVLCIILSGERIGCMFLSSRNKLSISIDVAFHHWYET